MCAHARLLTHLRFSKQQHADHCEEAEVQRQQQDNATRTGNMHRFDEDISF